MIGPGPENTLLADSHHIVDIKIGMVVYAVWPGSDRQ
jgi:hypothetical protein